MNKPLLYLQNLTIVVRGLENQTIVEDVSFEISHGEVLGIVGSSGSGKTTTAMSLLGLLPIGLKVKHGSMSFNDHLIAEMSSFKLQSLRATGIGMVFQEPLDAFNPVFTIGEQIREVVLMHCKIPYENSKKRVLEILDLVKVPDPRRVYDQYPHQLSGGLRQRAMIAQAIAAHPRLLIADEPTSNLDVTLQAKILELFLQLRQELSMSVLLITHDLGLVKHMCDRVIVLSEGKIVEFGKTNEVLNQAQHPFTQELLRISKNV